MSDQIQDTYEIRPLYEACPKEWRDRIPELAERYKKLYTALVYDIMAEQYNLPGRSLKPGIGPLERGERNGKLAFSFLFVLETPYNLIP